MVAIFSTVRLAWKGHYSTRIPFWDELLSIWQVLALSAVIYGIAVLLVRLPISRFLWPVSWILAAVFLPMVRRRVRRLLQGFDLWERTTVVVGATKRAWEVVAAIRSESDLGLRIDTLLDPSDEPDVESGTDIKTVISVVHLPAAGLLDWLEQNGKPHVIVVLDPDGRGHHGDWLEQLSLYDSGIQVVPTMSGLPLLGVGSSLIFRQDVLLLRVRNHLDSGAKAWLKRGFDVLASLLGLFLLSPLLFWVAVLIRRQGGEGAVFFGHERVGRGGRLFRCWKFRTMVSDSQKVLDDLLRSDPEALSEWERDFKLRNDPRITRVGAFLRRTSLDELPQLWNVLLGEMSLVGPRPVVVPEIERYGARADFYRSVRPGLTGLWQVSGRSELSYPERVALDAWYVKNWRFWYDIAILSKTVGAVLRVQQAR